MVHRYFCKDNGGRDLFFVALHDFGVEGDYFLDTSLGIDLDTEPDIKPLISEICRRDLVEEVRFSLINDLFLHLQAIPRIQSKFLPDYALDSQGRFNGSYLQILSEVVIQQNFSDYSAFSAQIRGFYFERMREAIPLLMAEGKLSLLNQAAFLDLLPNNACLQELYVEHFAEQMEFYSYQDVEESPGHRTWECFLMMNAGELAFFFIRNIS